MSAWFIRNVNLVCTTYKLSIDMRPDQGANKGGRIALYGLTPDITG